MKKKIRVSLYLFAAVSLLNSVEVLAASDMVISRPQSSGSQLYLGVKAGNADYDKIDDSDVSLDLFVGYRLDELLSVQGGYATLGEPSSGSRSVEVAFAHVEILGSASIKSDLSLYGHVGLFAWDYDRSIGVFSDSDSGIDVALGVGVDYAISSRYAIRFALDFYSLEPEVSGGKESEDITNFSVGVKFNL